MNNPEPIRIVLHVEGGVLQAVSSNRPDVEVSLWDFDNLGGNGLGLDGDFVEEQYLEATAGLEDCPIGGPGGAALLDQEKEWKQTR